MSHPVGVIARFAPLPEKRSDLQALLEGMVAPTRSEPGCRSYNLYEAPADGDLVLIERYDDQAALEHHRTTEHYLNPTEPATGQPHLRHRACAPR